MLDTGQLFHNLLKFIYFFIQKYLPQEKFPLVAGIFVTRFVLS
ncbi:hypothetical protein HMPREF1345_00608 [Enterococcus faecium TX1337RF]|nr:hypothetical protein HMPREF1345_00608 [Enterococcus faecium TX1337RF]